MEIIKDGKIDTRWIGQCRECNAVVLADVSEVGSISKINEDAGDDFAFADCPFCNDVQGVYFTRKGTKIATKILRQNNINSATLKDKK